MTNANTTNQLSLLKRIYGDKVMDPGFKRSKLLMLMKKDTKFGGEGRHVHIKIAGTAGGSSSFADALAAEDASQHKRFFVTHRKEYQTFSIDGDLISRTEGDKNALMSALKSETDSALYKFGRALAARVWGNQGGARGRLDPTVTLASTNLLLRNRQDHVRFEVGDQIQFSADDGTPSSPAGLRNSGATLTVVSINRATGNVVVSANLSTITGITVNDYVFRRGDYGLAMTGLPGWNPLVAPTGGESFFGVDRTVGDGQRQYGLIYDSTSDTTREQTIMRALARGQSCGIEVTHWFCNPLDYAELAIEVGSKKEVRVEDPKYKVSFKAIELNGPDGTVQVISEPDVPFDCFWATNVDQIYLRTAGDAPKILDADKVGLLLRKGTEDAYQGRLGAYGNVFNENPGNCIQGTW